MNIGCQCYNVICNVKVCDVYPGAMSCLSLQLHDPVPSLLQPQTVRGKDASLLHTGDDPEPAAVSIFSLNTVDQIFINHFYDDLQFIQHSVKFEGFCKDGSMNAIKSFGEVNEAYSKSYLLFLALLYNVHQYEYLLHT